MAAYAMKMKVGGKPKKRKPSSLTPNYRKDQKARKTYRKNISKGKETLGGYRFKSRTVTTKPNVKQAPKAKDGVTKWNPNTKKWEKTSDVRFAN